MPMAEFPLSSPGEADNEPSTTSTPRLQRKGNIRGSPQQTLVQLHNLVLAGAPVLQTLPETALQPTKRILGSIILNNIGSKQTKKM